MSDIRSRKYNGQQKKDKKSLYKKQQIPILWSCDLSYSERAWYPLRHRRDS